jgi:diguanylate cyclase (GGDEF)-like protein
LYRVFDRLSDFYSARPKLAAFALSALALAVLTLFHVGLGFTPALRVLYVLPIWFCTRTGGRAMGLAMVAATTVMNALVECRIAPGAAMWHRVCPDAILNFGALSAIMLLIAQVEETLARHQRLALHDPLTGLLNRRALEEFGTHAFGRARQFAQPLTVVMLDCDGFKLLNDRYGHAAGDHVLQLLARTLEENTRSSDLLARFGGDEFVVVLQDTDQAEAQRVMARVEHMFEQAVLQAGFEASLSVGFAPIEEESSSIDDLLKDADTAMYARKELKKASAYLN